MDFLVHQQATKPGKRFVTFLAAMRSLTRVRVHVISEQVGQPEALVTKGTLVRFVTVV